MSDLIEISLGQLVRVWGGLLRENDVHNGSEADEIVYMCGLTRYRNAQV